MEKRLYRSKTNRVIAGVCGGIAEYFNVDPALVRVIWVVISLTYGAGILAYIVAALVIPNRKDEPFYAWNQQTKNEGFEHGFNPDDWKQEPRCDTDKNRNTIGIILIALGVIFLSMQIFKWFDLKVILPLIFIALGIFLILQSRRNPQ